MMSLIYQIKQIDMKYYIDTKEFGIVEFFPLTECQNTLISNGEILGIEFVGLVKKPKQFRSNKKDKWTVYPTKIPMENLMTYEMLPPVNDMNITYTTSY